MPAARARAHTHTHARTVDLPPKAMSDGLIVLAAFAAAYAAVAVCTMCAERALAPFRWGRSYDDGGVVEDARSLLDRLTTASSP
ncbi:hypothetical protein LCGC14_2942320 [marine sediment metagenome]|uniref:Uncharacterized protein n=1 Tax=marine sediment metagenome TaxID=412755 RepID=A0A0F8Y4N6_9ZZZZ